MTLTLDIEFQCLRKLKLLNITNNSSMTIIINLVYCCVLNINAEFNLPSKYQICVLVPDDSFVVNGKLSYVVTLTLIERCTMFNLSEIFSFYMPCCNFMVNVKSVLCYPVHIQSNKTNTTDILQRLRERLTDTHHIDSQT